MVISHNLNAMNANRMLGIVTENNAKLAEKLSSGYRINRGADDAAGLSISEKMRRQIRGLNQAVINAQDGISMVQSAEGALHEMHEITQRGNELAIKAANGTLSDDDRKLLDEEIQQLKQALDEAAHSTVFNELKLFPDNGESPKASMQTRNYKVTYNIADQTFSVNDVTAASTGVSGSSGASGSVLADKIVNEYIPNAIDQIFKAFPALANSVGSDNIEMSLDISYIDGKSNTLAYCQCSFYPTDKPFNFLLKVDSADFTDADAQGTGGMAEALESTIAHELMHAVMFYTLTDGMTDRTNAGYPDWFVEGTAQLAGGGYTTGWNDILTSLTKSLGSENDTTADTDIENYLRSYTPDGRPYGHGYLAAAYLGYLANENVTGNTDVTSANIANGMNEIFTDLLSPNGKSFEEIIKDNTGISSEADLTNLFTSGNSDLVTFVRKLSKLTGDGAGSVITSSLAVGGTNIVNSASLPNQNFWVDSNSVNIGPSNTPDGANVIKLHVGVEPGVSIDVKMFNMDAEALGLKDTNAKTITGAENAIDEFKTAIRAISDVRGYYGAIQNRLEHTINNLNNVIENTTAAESAIRDTDMAKTMVEYANSNILLQAGQAVLAQANHSADFVLNLLR